MESTKGAHIGRVKETVYFLWAALVVASPSSSDIVTQQLLLSATKHLPLHLLTSPPIWIKELEQQQQEEQNKLRILQHGPLL